MCCHRGRTVFCPTVVAVAKCQCVCRTFLHMHTSSYKHSEHLEFHCKLCKTVCLQTCEPDSCHVRPTLSHVLPASVNAGKSPPIPYVYVNSSGSVRNYRPMQVAVACSLEMYAFPFDKQNCSLTFRSWLHSGGFGATMR